MKKVWFWWVLAGLVFLIFGSYRDSKQLEDMFLAYGIGIDVPQTENITTVTLIGPTFVEGAKEPSQVLTAQGYSVEQAISHMQNKTNQTISEAHARVLVFGEEAVKDGIFKYIDALIRNPSIRSDMYLVVTKGKAEDLLRINLKQNPFIALYLADMLEKGFEQSRVPHNTLMDILDDISSEGKDVVLPYIEAAKGKDSLVLNGLAIFNEDKFVGTISGDEAAAFMLLSNQLKLLDITYPSPVEINGQKTFSTIRLYRGKTDTKCRLQNGKLFIDMHFSGSADLIEYATTRLLSPDKITQEEKAVAERIKDNMESVIKKLQKEYKSDALGCGEKVRIQFPDYYKKINWKDVYPNINISVSADIKIKKTGTVR